jgi:hypothetical protein
MPSAIGTKGPGRLQWGSRSSTWARVRRASSTCPCDWRFPPQTWPASVTGGATILLPRGRRASHAILCGLWRHTEGLLRHSYCASHNSSTSRRRFALLLRHPLRKTRPGSRLKLTIAICRRREVEKHGFCWPPWLGFLLSRAGRWADSTHAETALGSRCTTTRIAPRCACPTASFPH